jgi:aryl-alcohol dehydrogenase-like predicted oxidoreductase
MMRSVEASLKMLQTDRLDLMQMHDVGPSDRPEDWEKPAGALAALRKLKDQKTIRFIGFTGHQRAETHRSVIEKLNFDTV